MTQTSPHLALNGSRLVRILCELDVSEVELSDQHYVDRLARLIDLSDSVSLSSAHLGLSLVDFEQRDVDANHVEKELFEVRGKLVHTIIKSFYPDDEIRPGGLRIRLPRPKPDATVEEASNFGPYQRFYAAHQREMDYKITYLQSFIRDAVAGHSAKLAQLVAMDTALGDTLTLNSRKFLAHIPTLLEKRFKLLRNEHQQGLFDEQEENPQLWLQAGGWLAQFCEELQSILLAELEVRLLPVLGLVDALNAELARTAELGNGAELESAAKSEKTKSSEQNADKPAANNTITKEVV